MPYIIQAASQRGKWMGYRLAVIEVIEGVKSVKMISERSYGVVRIVKVWNNLYMGKTDNCQYVRALREAQALSRQLNSK